MWMVVEYTRHEYLPSDQLEIVSSISVDEMKEHITIREAGWSPDHNEIESLSDRTHPLRWSLHYSFDEPTGDILHQTIVSSINRGFPIIVGIDVAKLRNRGVSGGHAVVATGIHRDRVIINDPWGEMGETVEWDRFADAWHPAHQTITTHLAGDAELTGTAVRELNER